MVPFIGQPFDAHITGITAFGLFVGLENGIEGLIHISLLTDDMYEFDEATYTMRGQLSGKVYHLGDALQVTLAKVNVEKCEIDFVPGVIESLEDLQQLMQASADRRHKKSGRKEGGSSSWLPNGAAAKKMKKGKKDGKADKKVRRGRKDKSRKKKKTKKK
ncbi:MAG: S1 RNA-binding domain-containing protein [Megasphaera cerevisiae]|nr:S1 RNA-binding domain-containing protein [Megasphaera cerevisiae]